MKKPTANRPAPSTAADPGGDPRLLRLKDVATRLNISIRTIQGWAASGRLPVLRLSPRAVRVTEEALAAFLEQAAEDGR